jgi:GNAT superfamily N-acetyltransferase
METKIATEEEKKKAIEIAQSLSEWFTKEGIKNLTTDFEHNKVVVATDNNNVVGFACYTTYCGKLLLIWMGVKRSHWRKKIGTGLLKFLENEVKSNNLYSIETETLPEEVKYEPYEITRAFYYSNGFKRIIYKKATIEGWDDQIVLEKRV